MEKGDSPSASDFFDFWKGFDIDKQKIFLNKNKSQLFEILDMISEIRDPIPIVEALNKNLSALKTENRELKRKFDELCKETVTSHPPTKAKLTATGSSSISADSDQSSETGQSPLSRYRTDFEEISFLGGGAYGFVFKCKNRVDKMLYAVKKIPFDSVELDKVLREVRMLSLLKHKNITGYYQAWIEKLAVDDSIHKEYEAMWEETIAKPKCLYIQMELCESKLSEVVKKEKIDKKIAWEYFKQIVEGVEYMHTKEVIHMDLGIWNVLLDESKNIKISDFGLAKSFEENVQPFTSSASIGNKLYRPPEMRKVNSNVDEKVDIYGLGVILFELLHFFPTTTEKLEILTNFSKLGKFSKSLNIEQYIQSFISELLSKEPGNRPSAAKILEQQPWTTIEKKDEVDGA
ncbi:hypothetical protein ACOSP7_023706 [Xanthoceras sorbifolium]